jgi:hypothetical protein
VIVLLLVVSLSRAILVAMKRILVALSLLVFSISLNANEPAIDFGNVEGSVYSHSYFELKITIPETWQVQDQDARERIMQSGEQVVSGSNQNLKVLIDASKLNTLNLVTIFRHPLAAAVDFNPSFMCVAEKVSHLPGIQRGSDYLFHTRKFLESAQLNYKFPGTNSEQTISGVSFDVMNAELEIQSVLIKQQFLLNNPKRIRVEFHPFVRY